MSAPTKMWWQFELPSARFSPDASADNSPTRPVSSPPGGSPFFGPSGSPNASRSCAAMPRLKT